MTRFPKPLRPGDLIAVTAPSSGVDGAAIHRLDLVLSHLCSLGYRLIEGQCLRREHKDASAPRLARAQELSRFLDDPEVSAIFPPWGGELASEVLEYIDFEKLGSTAPKWLLGFSDVSTIQLPLTLVAGWATAHGPNLMDLAPTQTDPLTSGVLSVLSSDLTHPVLQRSSTMFQKKWIDYAARVDVPLNLTDKTEWKRLDGSRSNLLLKGHLIGGCIDTIAWLAGTRYGDIPSFVRRAGKRGAIVYLENDAMSPPGLVRALLCLRRQGWFEGIAGLMLGRSAAPEPESASSLKYAEALQSVLGDLPCPVLYDIDIGHQPPQFTLINGAFAEVQYEDGRGQISQVAHARRSS
jgi:muramoyltetrapeptide carboxypeptidase